MPCEHCQARSSAPMGLNLFPKPLVPLDTQQHVPFYCWANALGMRSSLLHLDR